MIEMTSKTIKTIIIFWGGAVPTAYRKFPAQRSNLCHSSDLSHSGDKTRPLTARPPGNSRKGDHFYENIE